MGDRREELPGIARRCPVSLAESAEAEGEPDTAEDWWERAAGLDEHDQVILCRHMACLSRVGNHGGAVPRRGHRRH